MNVLLANTAFPIHDLIVLEVRQGLDHEPCPGALGGLVLLTCLGLYENDNVFQCSRVILTKLHADTCAMVSPHESTKYED